MLKLMFSESLVRGRAEAPPKGGRSEDSVQAVWRIW